MNVTPSPNEIIGWLAGWLAGWQYQLLRYLPEQHTEFITAMCVVWHRVVWSASPDSQICIWN